MAAQHIKEKINDILHPDQTTHQMTTPDAAAGFPILIPNPTTAKNNRETASDPGSGPDDSDETHSTAPFSGTFRQNHGLPPVPLDEAAMLGIAPVPTPHRKSLGETAPVVAEQEPAAAPTTPPSSDDRGLDTIGEERSSDSKAIIPVNDELPIVPVSDVKTIDREVIESDVETKNYPGPQPDVQEKNDAGTEPEGDKSEAIAPEE